MPARARNRGGAPEPAPVIPASSAVRAARSAIDGSRAVRAAGSRSCAKPLSSSATTRGRRGPHHRPRRHQIVRPAAAHQRLRLGGAGVAADQRRAAQLMGAQHRHLAGVRIGRPGLGERVVAVVPHHHQAEVGDGREHRAAGADDQPGAAAQHRQPAAVALCGAEPGRQGHDPRLRRRSRMAAACIASTSRWSGTIDQRAAAGVRRHRGGLGEPVGPRLPRQRLPDRARGAALAQRGKELLAARRRPPTACGSTGCGSERWRLGRSLLLDLGVPRRDGQPQHVGAGARVAGGDGVDESAHLRGQHRLGGHHAVQPAQLADMVCVRTPFEDERVDQPAVEPHPHPHPGLGVVGLLGDDTR